MKKLYLPAIALLILCLKAINADAQYCIPSALTCDEKIVNFTLNTINNSTSSSSCGSINQGYSDFTTITTNIDAGTAYTVSVSIMPAYQGDSVDIWVDYNHNNTFDANELITTIPFVSNISSGSTVPMSITIPTTALAGNTTLRARLRYLGTADACSALSYGEAEDYTVNIINTPCSGTPTAPTIVNAPMTSAICNGDIYTLDATSNNSGINGIIYQWQAASSSTGPWVNITNANALSYDATPQVTTYYRLMDSCTNSHQVAYSSVYTVNVYTPIAITTQTNDLAVCPGANTSFYVGATGSALAYQWQVDAGSGFTNLTNNATYSNVTTGTLTISNTTAGMNGYMYRCVVSSTTGCYSPITSNSATLTVGVHANITTSDSLSFCQGDSALLVADTAAGYAYQWMDNGQPIPGATHYSFAAHTSGIYSVQVTGSSCGSVSNTLTVVANPSPEPPVVTNSGADTICWGSSTVLVATADTGVVSYQWYLNNSYIIGATGTSFIAPDSGSYTIKVTNQSGCSALSQPVHITADIIPDSLIVQDGDSLCSYLPFASYQWYLNGQLIAGATNSCYMPTVNGSYSVLVTDGTGCSNMSDVFVLTNVGVPGVTMHGDEVKIYPNPANAVIHVDAPQKVSVTIANMQGQIVQQASNANNINISNLANGLYLIRVYDKDNILIKIEKLVKNM